MLLIGGAFVVMRLKNKGSKKDKDSGGRAGRSSSYSLFSRDRIKGKSKTSNGSLAFGSPGARVNREEQAYANRLDSDNKYRSTNSVMSSNDRPKNVENAVDVKFNSITPRKNTFSTPDTPYTPNSALSEKVHQISGRLQMLQEKTHKWSKSLSSEADNLDIKNND